MQKFLRTLMLVALMLPFASQAQNTLTVADGTTTNSNVPIHGLYVDDFTRCQIIYPASEIEASAQAYGMTGGTISSLTFYLSSPAAASWGDAYFEVKMMEVPAATLSGFVDVTNATTVYAGALDGTSTPMTITFTTPYTYQGGNLLLEIGNTVKGTYKSASFYGVNATGASWQGYNGNSFAAITGSAKNFMPKTTFTFTGGTEITCRSVTNLAIDATATTANSLTLTWTDALNTGATYSVYDMSDTTLIQSDITGTTFTATGLDANTEYTLGVEANCSATDAGAIMTVSGRTACAAISLPWTCGFEAEEIQGTTNVLALPWCSYRYTVGATTASNNNYPYSYSSTTYAHSGSRSLYFYGATSAAYPDSMTFILPELDVTTYPMNANRLTFWAMMSTTTNSKDVYVGTVTDPTDPSTYTPVGFVTITGTTHTKYSVPLTTATATAPYVCITVLKGSGTMYIDDVTLEEMPSCLEVPTVAVDAVTSSSITLSWTENPGNASATYSVYNMADTSLVASNINDTTYTVDNLDANTVYTFAVQANCTAGDAPFTTVSGRTACGTFAAPYTWDFEDMNTSAVAICWTKLGGGSANVTSGTTTDQYHSATKYIQFSGVAGNNMLVLPETEDEISALQLRFWTRPESFTSSSCGTFSVGYVTDPTDATTFVAVTTYTYSDFTAYEEKTVTFGGAPTGARMAMRHDANATYYYWRVDDVTIEEVPSCLPVTVVLDSLMGTTAYVSWANTGASSYEVEVRQNDVAVTTASVLIEDDTTAVISDLDIDNDYQIVVRADCGSDYSPWSSPVNVHIGYCLPNPTSVDGSGITGVAFGGMTNTTSHPTSAPFYMNNSTMAGSVPAGTTASVDITFATGYTYGTIIWVDWNNSMSFDANEVVYRGTSLNTNPTTLTAEFDIPATMEEGNYRMRIAAADSYFDSYVSNPANNPNPCFSNTYSWAEDYTLTVTEAPSCTHVTGLTATDITAESVVLRWTGAADAYNVYEITGTDATLVETVNVDTVLIENLTAMTDYTFGVASACGSDESDTVYVSFTTACATAVMPFTQNFNNLTSGIPMCWDNSEGTTTTADYRWNYYATGHGGAGLRFNCYYNSDGNTNVLATPAITIDEAAQLSFWYKNPTGGDFTVMVGIAGSDTRTTLATGLTGASDWTLATYVLPDSLVDEDVVVYFKGTSNYGNGDAYIYLDDVTIEAVPDCMPVSDLAATNVTADSATLTWTGTADSYNVYTIVGDDTTLVDNVTDTFMVIDELTAMTSYIYGVRSACGSDESSMMTVSFRTACSSIAIPFTEDFENGIDCWTMVDCASGTNVVANDSYTTYAYSGTHAFKFAYNTNPPQYLISPELTGGEDGVQVSFMYKAGGNYTESFALGYSTTTNDVSAFTWLTEQTGITNQTYAAYTGYLPAGTKYVAVKYTANDQLSLYIDSLVFSPISADFCFPVTGLAVDTATANSVTINWNGDATSYSIYNGNTYIGSTTDTFYTFNGLTASTAYTFGVTAVCSATDSADMVTISAMTDCEGGSCTITIVGTDEYGDGWDDSYIDIQQNGGSIGHCTVEGDPWAEGDYPATETYTYTVCAGVPVTFTWVNGGGNYDYEASFVIKNGNDSVLYTASDASELTAGSVFYTANNVCGSDEPQPHPQVEEATIDASAVTYWVGTGNNQVVMAVNWADTALAWGVNFSTDSITSQAALDTIAANDPRFSWTTGSYGLGNITFTENGTTLTGDANHFWESKRNTISDAGLSQNLGNGDFQKWANSAAGVVVDSMEYSGVWYYMYNYPMTIYPVTAPQPGPQPADSIVVTFATNDATLGTTTPAPGTYTYHAGDTIRFSANATTGNSFVEWVIDYGDGTTDTLDAQYTAAAFLASTMIGYGITNMTLTANFQAGVTAPDSISVTYTVNDAVMGTITPNGTIRQAVGSTISATATANDGYRIHGWRLTIMAGGQVASDTTFVTATTSASFGTIPQNFVTYGASVIVTAIFEAGAPDSVAVTYAVNDATMGSITPNGTVMTAVGDSIAATATANAGYELYGWRFTVYVNGAVASDTTIAIVETSVNFGAVPQFYADANATVTITAMFQQQVGIEDADISNVNVYSANSTIYVRGAEGQSVYVFDVNGRMLNHEAKASESCSFRMENTGVYLVKVGNAAAQRVIVVR